MVSLVSWACAVLARRTAAGSHTRDRAICVSPDCCTGLNGSPASCVPVRTGSRLAGDEIKRLRGGAQAMVALHAGVQIAVHRSTHFVGPWRIRRSGKLAFQRAQHLDAMAGDDRLRHAVIVESCHFACEKRLAIAKYACVIRFSRLALRAVIAWMRAPRASKPARSSRAISRAIRAMSLSAIAASSPFS